MRAVWAAVLAALLTIGVVASQPATATEGLTLSVGDQSGLERDSVTGSVFVPIYLSDPAPEPVTVALWTVEGTATAGVDYTTWGTPSAPRTVTIPTGATQTQVNVPILADDLAEDDETFSVVATATGGGVVVGDDTGTATIVDADEASGANPAVTVSSPTIVEGDTGQRRAQFQIHLSRPPATNVTISYTTADGTAVAGQDYVAKLPGTVVFAPGQISKTIDVLVDSNTGVDGDRAFSLEVTVMGGSPVEELRMTGTATISDDDTAAAVACAPGTFNTTDGNEPCEPAPLGTYVDTTGAAAPTLCAAGSFQGQTGQTSCELAPVGSYVFLSGAMAPTSCPDGTTTADVGATSPADCIALPLGVTGITAGLYHSCALLDDGTVQCWGDNYLGALGDGGSSDQYGAPSAPRPVQGMRTATAIAAGGAHTCAVLETGTVSCWGRNLRGELGNGTTATSRVPVPVSGLTEVISIAAGDDQTCAVRSDGTVWCWGMYYAGGPFSGGLADRYSTVPVEIPGISSATAVAATRSQRVCVLMQDGSVSCWGNSTAPTPVAVGGISTATAIAMRTNTNCALLADSTVRCWSSSQTTASGEIALSNVEHIAGGASHLCAVLESGAARCTGTNTYGQLGDGTTTSSNSWVAVSGVDDARMTAGGLRHSCAVVGEAGIRCWGDNTLGQLGDDTTTESLVPVPVVGFP